MPDSSMSCPFGARVQGEDEAAAAQAVCELFERRFDEDA